MARLRILLHGLLAGALLSFLRAPLGLDWTQVPAADGRSASLLRAGALLGIALGLGLQGNAFRGAGSAWWCLAALAGYASHGLFVQPWDPIETRFGFALALIASTLGLRFLAGRRSAHGLELERARGVTPEHLVRSERFGLVLVGFGCALALESLARELRLFGLGLTLDDTVFGSVFLALVFVGALAFGPLLVHARLERAALAGGLALAAGATVLGLGFLAQLDAQGLFGYLQRFESLVGPLKHLDERWGVLGLASIPTLDNASMGTGWTDAALAAAALVAPCFLLGAGLGAARHTGRWAHALCGAALGLLVGPYLVRASAEPLAASELARTPWAWNWCAAASFLSALGALCVALGAAGRERVAGIVLACVACVLPWVRPRVIVWSFSPWYHATIEPELVHPTDAGLVTVETVRGTRIVTLDRRRMSPTAEEEASEERAFRYAWSLVPAEKKEAGAVRTLFVGQLTPARARMLSMLGPLEIERTAAWFPAFEAIESLLFAGEAPPPGTPVAPARARARLAEGAYDFVLVPAVHGPGLLWRSQSTGLWASTDAPAIAGLSLPDGSLGVAWVAADSTCARRELGEEIALAMDRLEHFQVGIVRGAHATGAKVVQLLPAGEPVDEPGTLELLATQPNLRSFLLLDALGRRLAAAGSGGPQAELARGFAIHLGAQKLSSPFESRAQSIELEEESLRAFLAAVPATDGLDPLMRDVWEDVAWLLTEKRSPDLAVVYLEALAERFQPWGALDRALGRAYREHLEPGVALRYLERSAQEIRYRRDVSLWIECAECAMEMGDPERAAGYYERALSLAPDDFVLRKRRAIALQAAGDENGPTLLEELLLEHPDDPEILSVLGLVPAPPAPDPPPDPDDGGTGE